MTTLAPEPVSDPHYVLAWRDGTSRRLRTYASSDGRPLSCLLSIVSPQPTTVIDTPVDLVNWLDSPPDRLTVAITEDLARSELGWNPERTETLG